MSDNKSVTIKTILDKTGILIGIKEIQGWIKRNPLRLTAKVDLSDIEKDVQTTMKKLNKQVAQTQKQAQNSISQKSRDAGATPTTSDSTKTSAVSGSPPVSSSSKQSGGLMRLIPPSANLLS